MFYQKSAKGKTMVKHFDVKQRTMITTKIIFDRKKTAKKDGNGTIEIRLTVARKTYYISTGVRVREKEWKVGRVVNRPDADVLNQRIAAIYEKVCEEANASIKEGRPINVASIKGQVWSKKDELSDEPLFLSWVEDQIALLNISPGTRKQYKTVLTRLTEFGQITKWRDITAENISNFDAWLHQRKKKSGEAIIDAAVYKYHRCLKALLNRAVTFGRIERNPYDLLRGKIKRGEKENVEYLTEKEMKAIENLDVSGDETMAISRDIFVFQMYTGLSYSDAQAFDFSQYKKVKGKWINTGERIKTGVPFVSSLLPPALKILEKYDYKIPQIENHIYNRALKALGVMAKISTPLHSHLARHTFATWMLRNGAKIENVSRMLGHTNIRQTQRYAKVLAESVHEDFDMVAAKMAKKKTKKKK
jgi:integrase